MEKKLRSLLISSSILLLFTSGCGTIKSATPQNETIMQPKAKDTETIDSVVETSVDWADILKWNGKKYYYNEELTNSIEKEMLDEEIGEIIFSVIGSAEEKNPDYQLKDNEATKIRKGSKIYSVQGYDSSEVIYVLDKVYIND